MIDSVTIAGNPLDPCHVLATVTVLHGRKGFAEAATASSATITIKQAAGGMPTWQSGDTVTIGGPHGPMFSGRIVNRSMSHTREPDGTPVGLITITCAGPVAALGIRMVGDVPWPQEAGTVRADKILTAAQVPYRVEGSPELQVLARDVDAQPALGLLDELAESTGATVFDTPDGHVVYQTMQERSRPVDPFMWQDFPEPPPPVGPVYGPPVSGFTVEIPDGNGGVQGSYGNDITFAVAGRVTHLRHYRTPTTPGADTRTMRLWRGPDPGTMLGAATTTGEVDPGWYSAALPAPVPVTAGETLRVALHLPTSVDRSSRYNINAAPIVNGPLTVGQRTFGVSGVYDVYPPDSVVGDRLYFIDVVFEPQT